MIDMNNKKEEMLEYELNNPKFDPIQYGFINYKREGSFYTNYKRVEPDVTYNLEFSYDPPWSPYYIFSSEFTCEDGTKNEEILYQGWISNNMAELLFKEFKYRNKFNK
jgi:hypothetical protein